MDGTTEVPEQRHGGEAPDVPTVLVLVDDGQDRNLLKSYLRDYHETTVADDPPCTISEFDVCLFDATTYDTYHEEYQELCDAMPVDAPPAMLLVPHDSPHRESATVWETVDDIVTRPTTPTELTARIDRLLTNHHTTTQLLDKEQQLTDLATVLDVANRSIEAAPFGVMLIDAADPDNPIVDVNHAFTQLTGYPRDDLIGNTPRMLGGQHTEPKAADILETAVDTGAAASTEITNYRADGTRYVDHVETAPVTDDDGTVTHHIEFHRDVTNRRLRENRLQVINRLLRHNLRNDLNQVKGYAALLASQIAEPSLQQYANSISVAATNLIEVGEKLHRAEDALTCPAHHLQPTTVTTLLETADTLLNDHPGVTHSTTCTVDGELFLPQIVVFAVEELLDNAVCHHPDNTPTVDVTVTDGPKSLITVTISDDGPGIPDGVQTILETGETPLQHGDGVGLWIVKWITDVLGGHISFQTTGEGTTVNLTVPTIDPEQVNAD